MNDAITFASYMKDASFTVYFAHNPKQTEFLNYFHTIYKYTTNYLVIYYTGHGDSVEDQNGDEADGFDEALVFDDDFLVDDELGEVIAHGSKNSGSTVLLINDCCHSGSIYDIQNGHYQGMQLPAKVMSLSTARDKETAKQTTVGSTDQGIFTFYLFKLLSENQNTAPNQMETKIESICILSEKCTKFNLSIIS